MLRVPADPRAPARSPRDASATAGALVALGLLSVACAEPAPLHHGTHVSVAWPASAPPNARATRGLTGRVGEVAILEGDAELVSGAPGQYGLRFDETRNDLAAIAARFAAEFVERPATLVVFTTFSDRGGGGPAYFVPLFNDTAGTGLGALDQRAAFGVRDLEGFVNMKRREDHAAEDRLPLLVHEIAHRHLAYLAAEPADGSTIAPALLGRQQAHWQASLHTQGSVLGGHGFVQTEPGRFVVSRRDDALSGLDLYGLGLLDASELDDVFYIEDPRTQDGFRVPTEAQLEVGDEVTGTAVPVAASQIVGALGPRPRDDAPLEVAFALLTAPGEAATEAEVREEAAAIDALRARVEAAWPGWTRDRGQLCTALTGCAPIGGPDGGGPDGGAADAGARDADPMGGEDPGGCRTAGGPSVVWAGGALLALARRRRRRK